MPRRPAPDTCEAEIAGRTAGVRDLELPGTGAATAAACAGVAETGGGSRPTRSPPQADPTPVTRPTPSRRRHIRSRKLPRCPACRCKLPARARITRDVVRVCARLTVSGMITSIGDPLTFVDPRAAAMLCRFAVGTRPIEPRAAFLRADDQPPAAFCSHCGLIAASGSHARSDKPAVATSRRTLRLRLLWTTSGRDGRQRPRSPTC